MTDRPILFSAPMVRALLEGRKTQTRRLAWKRHHDPDLMRDEDRPSPWQRAQPGDTLWVRETFSLDRCGSRICWYWADLNPEFGDWTEPKPSIYMPRWASRITLHVEAVRVERLQEISEADALAEGAYNPDAAPGMHPDIAARDHFRHLWNTLHGEGAWQANPEVVVIGFRVEAAREAGHG